MIQIRQTLDWDEFLSIHDYRYGVISMGIAEGMSKGDMAHQLRLKRPQLTRLTEGLAADVLAFMGDGVLGDALDAPVWRANLRVKSEQVACRADRRRW